MALVDSISDLFAKLAGAKSPREKEALERQIHAARRQIDLSVEALYGVKSADTDAPIER